MSLLMVKESFFKKKYKLPTRGCIFFAPWLCRILFSLFFTKVRSCFFPGSRPPSHLLTRRGGGGGGGGRRKPRSLIASCNKANTWVTQEEIGEFRAQKPFFFSSQPSHPLPRKALRYIGRKIVRSLIREATSFLWGGWREVSLLGFFSRIRREFFAFFCFFVLLGIHVLHKYCTDVHLRKSFFGWSSASRKSLIFCRQVAPPSGISQCPKTQVASPNTMVKEQIFR